MTQKLKKYEPLFAAIGYRLEHFNGLYGMRYYFIKESDYQAGYRDYKYSTDLDITLELLKEESK